MVVFHSFDTFQQMLKTVSTDTESNPETWDY